MIKTFLLNRKCRHLSKLQKNEHQSYRNAHSIGILYNSMEYGKELIEELSESFSGDGKEIASMAYTEKLSEDRFSFCKKDVTVTGSLQKESIGFFANQPFDFLISLDTTGDINFKYVLALSKATCKVGINTEAHRDLLLMSIQKLEDQSQNIRDIIKYLKKI